MSRTPYDHSWQAVRLQILARDGHVCQVRGPKCKRTATQVDHIVPLSEGGARLDPDNLRASCTPSNAGRQNARNPQLARALQRDVNVAAPSRSW